MCGNDDCLTIDKGRSVRHEKGGLFGAYWVGTVGGGTKLGGQVTLPGTQAHKDDRAEDTVGWVCDKWQQFKDRGRARRPNPAAGVEVLNAEGGDRLRSEVEAAARRAHQVANDARAGPLSILPRHPPHFIPWCGVL